MGIEIDAKDPIGSLERAGIAHKKTDTPSSSSFAINGIPLGGSTTVGERHAFTLPAESKVEAVFSPEKLGKKIVKIFKKELQVGDAGFDDVVYIDTSDKDVAAKFLEVEGRRDIILGFVAEGGRVALDKSKVAFEVKGGATEEDLGKMARLIADVVAF